MAEAQPSSEVLSAEADRVTALARRGHTLRIHMDAPLRHLNPMVAPSLWTVRIAADTVFETLIRYEPPEGGAGAGPGSYRPGLARSWRVSPTGQEIRVELEPDVRFHDGKRMTSVDVQFSLDAVRNPRLATEHLQAEFADVVAVELAGPRALRIRTSRPSGYVLRALAAVPILPAHVYQGQLAAKRGPVVGTGPYRLATWTDSVVELTRWEDYWGPAPSITDIAFVHEPDAAQALIAAKRGEIDIVPSLIPAHYPSQASAPGLAASFVPLRLRPPRLRYLAMAANRPPLDDARMRHALALLIDRKTLIKEVHGGLARAVAGPVWPGGPGDGPAAAPPSYDPGRAATLMDRAGWRDRDGDGIRERDGQRLRLSLLVLENAGPREHAERDRVLASFRRAGILVDKRVGTKAVLKNRLRDGDFDLAFVDRSGAVDRTLSPLLGTGGEHNYGRFSGRPVDAALAALDAAWQPSSRAPLMADLARALSASWPLAPVVAPDPYGLVHRRVRGVVVWNGWLRLRTLSLATAPTTDR